MRTVYKVLAYLIAAEVVVQAMVMVYGIAGLGKWVDEGGVLDQAAMESSEAPFPEVVGLIIHGINGMFVIPVLALLLLIASFFVRSRAAVMLALAVVVLTALQIVFGLVGHSIPFVGALHGLTPFLLAGAAAGAASRVGRPAARPVADAEAPAATRV